MPPPLPPPPHPDSDRWVVALSIYTQTWGQKVLLYLIKKAACRGAPPSQLGFSPVRDTFDNEYETQCIGYSETKSNLKICFQYSIKLLPIFMIRNTFHENSKDPLLR